MLGHRTLNAEDYWIILKRRWWILLLTTAILPILAFAFTFTIAPEYLSQTLVLIESQKVPDSYVKAVISSDLDSRLASMREQILSRSRLQPIIERYDLYSSGKFSMDERIDMARKSIAIKPISSDIAHSGGLPGFFISFKAGDPHVAQMICGEITSLFLGENLRSRETSAEGTTSFLKSQLDDAKRSLDEQDAKLADFQRAYAGKLPDESEPNMNMLSSLNTQLEATTQALSRMEQDKAYAESMLAQQAQSLPTSPTSLGAIAPGAIATPQQLELQSLQKEDADLSSRYTADYPDVISVRRKIADLRRQIARTPAVAGGVPGSGTAANRYESPGTQQLRAQIRAAEIGIQAKKQEQAQILGNIHTYQGRIEATPIVEQQYKELTRDHQTAQSFYEDLLGKMNQSKMATDLEKRQEGEQFRVMDEPNLPDAPFSPKRGVFIMGGLVGGLVLGAFISALLEYKDTTLRTERDVWAMTKLPTLAIIAFTELPAAESRSAGFLQRFRRRSATPKSA